MPRMDDDSNANPADSLAKLLLIGDGKVGKTWYAGMAAAAGFNVLYFDGDVGRPTLKQLPKEVRSRIYALDVADTLGGGVKDSKFLDTMQEFTSSIVMSWNDSQQRMAKKSDPETDTIWRIKPARMDHTCVFVLDSWTGLSESMMTAAGIAHGVDLASATTTEMRPVYQSAGLKSMQILQCIRSLRCHVIVLAHPDEYTHTIKPEGAKLGKVKETELVIDWTKLIPKSTSKPNSLQMGKYFTDIAWAETNATGNQRLINMRLDANKVSGGHWNDRKSFDDFSFGNLVRHLGGQCPSESPSLDAWLAITSQAAGSSMDSAPKPILESKEQIILDSTSQSAVSTPTMKSLFAKKAAAGAK